MSNKAQSGTVGRAMSLLFELAGSGGDGFSLGRVSDATRLSKSTSHRLLATLIAQGMAERVPGARLYRLGPAALALARRRSTLDHVENRWRQGMVDVVTRTNDPSFLLMRCGDDALCVAAFYGSFEVRTLTSGIGGRMPLGSGPGSIVILAALPDSQVQAIVTRNRRRLEQMGVRSDLVINDVRETRARGYCYDPGNLITETAGLALTLPRPRAAQPMAVSVGTLRARLQGDRVVEMVHLLQSLVAQTDTRALP